MQNITTHIPEKLKSLRQEKAWSLDKTATETGVSKAMLGQIERGESSPTIATLWKIATGFQVSFTSFLESATKNPVRRSGKLKKLHQQDVIQFTPIFPFDRKLGFEVFVIALPAQSEHLSSAHEAGVIEHIIVAEGTMEVLCKGRWKKLNKGEGFRFNASQAHGYRNKTNESACFHNIIYYPK